MLEQLENNEFVLLMYLAGELPAEDRVEVEAMLSTDPILRAELDRLQSAQEAIGDALARLDARLSRSFFRFSSRFNVSSMRTVMNLITRSETRRRRSNSWSV